MYRSNSPYHILAGATTIIVLTTLYQYRELVDSIVVSGPPTTSLRPCLLVAPRVDHPIDESINNVFSVITQRSLSRIYQMAYESMFKSNPNATL